MGKKHKIGRNEPCPCGSGKKYKYCCGSISQPRFALDEETDHIKLNREIAYRGRIGRMREEFCKQYIQQKQAAFRLIERRIKQQASAAGENITCHKGCYYCCSQYIGVSIQECEAIVYYLYHHEKFLEDFLAAYPEWRKEVRKNEPLFQKIGQHLTKPRSSNTRATIPPSFWDDSGRYFAQDISCPFLADGLCPIYEVRPWACAGYFVVDPAERCKPESTIMPKYYEVHGKWEIEQPIYGKSKAFAMSSLPIGVYNILTLGTYFLSEIPGLESLEQEATGDSEVRAIIQRYLKTS